MKSKNRLQATRVTEGRFEYLMAGSSIRTSKLRVLLDLRCGVEEKQMNHQMSFLKWARGSR